MEQNNLGKVQSLIKRIDSCKNPREARAWLHTLRGEVKEVGYGNLDRDSMESVARIEELRGDSSSRVAKMKAFNSGFDGVSKDYSTLVKGIDSGNLYSAADVAQVFQKQITTSLDDCANDNCGWFNINSHFSGLVSQGVIPQEIVNEAISKRQLTKLQKGFGYDISLVQTGVQQGHLDAEDVAVAALSALGQRDLSVRRNMESQDLFDEDELSNYFISDLIIKENKNDLHLGINYDIMISKNLEEKLINPQNKPKNLENYIFESERPNKPMKFLYI